MAGERRSSGGNTSGGSGKPDKSPRARSEPCASVLHFPTRRRHAWPRPPRIETVHPRFLKRIAGIYADQLMLLGEKPARAYVNGLGWQKGLRKHLDPVIREEIDARWRALGLWDG